MTTIGKDFASEVKFFVNNHKLICTVLAIGLAIVGYSFGKAVSWIIESYGTTKKADDIAKKTLSSPVNTPEPSSTPPVSNLSVNSNNNAVPVSSPIPPTQIELLRAEYDLLKSKNSETVESLFFEPQRRVCGYGCGSKASRGTIQAVKADIFVTDEEIIKKHPMRFLPNSPFIVEDTQRVKETLPLITEVSDWMEMVDKARKEAQAITKTKEEGKHVILQLAVKSCVPTCMGMLILDQGKTPNYQAIKDTHLANTDQAIEWAKEAGLKCKVTKTPKEDIIKSLSKLLDENGPGMLEIVHPVLKGHVVILDYISEERGTATIRDSFHGWMITLKLDAFKKWIQPNKDFLQIKGIGL